MEAKDRTPRDASAGWPFSPASARSFPANARPRSERDTLLRHGERPASSSLSESPTTSVTTSVAPLLRTLAALRGHAGSPSPPPLCLSLTSSWPRGALVRASELFRDRVTPILRTPNDMIPAVPDRPRLPSESARRPVPSHWRRKRESGLSGADPIGSGCCSDPSADVVSLRGDER